MRSGIVPARLLTAVAAPLFTGFLFALVFAPMAVEARRAASNEHVQRQRGGMEATGDVYRIMRLAYPGAFLVMILEQAVRGEGPCWAVVAGLALFIAAKVVKWWAIVTLGSSWTFRVIVVPGAPLVAGGPYRYVRHPNYLAVIGELVGTALMAGAFIAGPIGVVGFGLLMWKRIAVEERALRSGR